MKTAKATNSEKAKDMVTAVNSNIQKAAVTLAIETAAVVLPFSLIERDLLLAATRGQRRESKELLVGINDRDRVLEIPHEADDVAAAPADFDFAAVVTMVVKKATNKAREAIKRVGQPHPMKGSFPEWERLNIFLTYPANG
ncbi:unnamed protein product [Dovyalis caffra]|uniref:Uncharacterized protein n=1 Tax=Dovyalis caffra TaxID=77055 RepID=A0AAV1SHF6_9ROSI|nr:unnamed protein product [Dovyalis caffra]